MGISLFSAEQFGIIPDDLIPPLRGPGSEKAWLTGIASPGMPSITALGRGKRVHSTGGVPVLVSLARVR